MPYVERDGDWSRRQPAKIDQAEMFVFPVPLADPSRIDALCDEQINDHSNRIKVTPWRLTPGSDPLVLLAAADFSKIRSDEVNEKLKGHIQELDVGLFVPVEVRVDGGPARLYVLNPYIYVDNPAGLIMGREIFGFPKILGTIGWRPSILEFDLRSLIFKSVVAGTPATTELVLELRRTWLLSLLAPFFGSAGSIPIGQGDDKEAIARVTREMSVDLLQWVGAIEAGGPVAGLLGFAEVRIPLLKQYRTAAVGTGAAYQEVVRATFSIESISAFKIYPRFLFWLSPLTLHLHEHANVDIAAKLGLAKHTRIRRGFRVVCGLKLTGSTF